MEPAPGSPGDGLLLHRRHSQRPDRPARGTLRASRQGANTLDLLSAGQDTDEIQAMCRCCDDRRLALGLLQQYANQRWLGTACRYRASGPASLRRQPGCAASWESLRISLGESLLFPGLFSGFLRARSPQAFQSPKRRTDAAAYYTQVQRSPGMGPGVLDPWRRYAKAAEAFAPSALRQANPRALPFFSRFLLRFGPRAGMMNGR